MLTCQKSHNTNITNVVKPGGSYNKWVLSQQDQNYLPFWMNAAGYKTECEWFPVVDKMSSLNTDTLNRCWQDHERIWNLKL